jgi:hypothetical protein
LGLFFVQIEIAIGIEIVLAVDHLILSNLVASSTRRLSIVAMRSSFPPPEYPWPPPVQAIIIIPNKNTAGQLKLARRFLNLLEKLSLPADHSHSPWKA